MPVPANLTPEDLNHLRHIRSVRSVIAGALCNLCIGVALIVLPWTGMQAHDQVGGWHAHTYDEVSTPESRARNDLTGPYPKDIHVWVYTSQFAKRFGMPERWIDDSLKGAEALAYRVEWLTIEFCGYFRDQENCRPDSQCVIDVYMADDVSAQLPWKNDLPVDHLVRQKTNSATFLLPQNEEDHPDWDSARKQFDHRLLEIGPGAPAVAHGGYNSSGMTSMSGSATVLEYDRRIFPGMDYMSLDVICTVPREGKKVQIWFPDPSKKFLGHTKDQEMQNAHTIYVPDSFMERVHDYQEKVYAPRSLLREVENRLINKKSPIEK